MGESAIKETLIKSRKVSLIKAGRVPLSRLNNALAVNGLFSIF